MVVLGRMGIETIVVERDSSIREVGRGLSLSVERGKCASRAWPGILRDGFRVAWRAEFGPNRWGLPWLSRNLAPREALPASGISTRRRALDKDAARFPSFATNRCFRRLDRDFAKQRSRGSAGTVVSNSLSRGNPGRKAAYRRRGELSPNY